MAERSLKRPAPAVLAPSPDGQMFNNFFAKRSRYPSFRTKWGTQSVEYTTSAFQWDGKTLTLAKMIAPLAIVWSRTLPKAARITTVTISRDAAGGGKDVKGP